MLTLKQRKTYEFIEAFFKSNQYAPTVAEIAVGIGIRSRGVVHRYVKALEAARLIQITPNRHRNIRLTSESSVLLETAVGMPLLGSFRAGGPIELLPEQQHLDIGDLLLSRDRYALRVRGDGMAGQGIVDGDVILCDQGRPLRDGQMVLALIDDTQTVLDRFYQDIDGYIVLGADRYSADRITVRGAYVGLLRLTNN